MKQTDFNRLKTVCEKEGFEFHVTDRNEDQASIIIQKKERVKVEGIGSGGWEKNKPEWEYNFKFKISDLREEAKTMHNKVLPFLSSKLEEYLNKESQ